MAWRHWRSQLVWIPLFQTVEVATSAAPEHDGAARGGGRAGGSVVGSVSPSGGAQVEAQAQWVRRWLGLSHTRVLIVEPLRGTAAAHLLGAATSAESGASKQKAGEEGGEGVDGNEGGRSGDGDEDAMVRGGDWSAAADAGFVSARMRVVRAWWLTQIAAVRFNKKRPHRMVLSLAVGTAADGETPVTEDVLLFVPEPAQVGDLLRTIDEEVAAGTTGPLEPSEPAEIAVTPSSAPSASASASSAASTGSEASAALASLSVPSVEASAAEAARAIEAFGAEDEAAATGATAASAEAQAVLEEATALASTLT